jgi:hypothetical protein
MGRTGKWSAALIMAATAGVSTAGVATAGVGILTPAVAQAAVRAAPAKAVNLIRDPGAERAKPDAAGGKVKVAGWTVAKGIMFTAVAYGAPEFPGRHSPGPKVRGKNFFAGGPSGTTSGATQIDPLAADARLIGSGKAVFRLSAFLGGFSTQSDFATLTVTWETAKGKILGHATIGPVTQAQRKGVTGLLRRSKGGAVPASATRAVIRLHMVRKAGEYVDGYADNLSLTIAKKG